MRGRKTRQSAWSRLNSLVCCVSHGVWDDDPVMGNAKYLSNSEKSGERSRTGRTHSQPWRLHMRGKRSVKEKPTIVRTWLIPGTQVRRWGWRGGFVTV